MSEKMSCSKDLFPPHVWGTCVYWFVRLGMISNIWKVIKSICLFRFGLWCGEANSIHLPNIKDFFSLRDSSSVTVTKPKSFSSSLCYSVSILLVSPGFLIVKFMKILANKVIWFNSPTCMTNQWISIKYDVKGFPVKWMWNCCHNNQSEQKYSCYMCSVHVAQTVENGASDAEVLGSIPRGSENW